MKFHRNLTVNTLLIILTVILLTACNSKVANKSTNVKEYTGQELKVGVVGEIPKVMKKNINLVSIDFTDFQKQNLASYDGIIITKEHLTQASENQYADVYNQSNIPFFFMQSEKSYLPFADNQTTYDQAIKVKNKSYTTGYINTNEIVRHWELSLNDKLDDKKAVNEVYSRIFMLIEKIKISKSDQSISDESVEIKADLP